MPGQNLNKSNASTPTNNNQLSTSPTNDLFSHSTNPSCPDREIKMPAHQQINDLNSSCRSGTNKAPLGMEETNNAGMNEPSRYQKSEHSSVAVSTGCLSSGTNVCI